MRFVRLVAVSVLLSAFVGLPVRPAVAQSTPFDNDPRVLPLGVIDGVGYFLQDGDLVSLRFADGAATRRPIELPMGLFQPETVPKWNSAGVSPDGKSAWLWDASVGPVIRIGLGTDSTVTGYPLRPSYAQFGHGEGFHPRTGRPLVYGGYGYYRVQDMLLEFLDGPVRWLEVPWRGDKHPGGRYTSIMVSGWDESRITIVGGFSAQPNTSPPVNSLQRRDAWNFDFADSTWTELPLDALTLCALESTWGDTGFVVPDPVSGSVFLSRPWNCGTTDLQGDAVIQWFPATGRSRVLGFYDNRHLALTTKIAALFRESTSDSVAIVFWGPQPERPLESWTRRTVRFAVPPDLSPAGRAPGTSALAVLGLLLVALAAALGWRRRARSASQVVIRANGNGSPIEIIRGRESASILLSPGAGSLLRELARLQPSAGDTVSAETIQGIFDADYPDPDSARTLKNRSIDELNTRFTQHFGTALLDRVRRADDARRFDYRVLVGVRGE